MLSRFLLDAGANPRKANGKGEDPYDLVDDLHGKAVAAEMRGAITEQQSKEAVNENLPTTSRCLM